mgnify:CR=1 FL=1
MSSLSLSHTHTHTHTHSGVVHAVTADVAINGGTFEKNWAEAAGGVLSLLEAKLSIEGGAVFQENWVNTKGGVLISLLGTISIAGPATFRENRASLGGVMYLAELDGTQPVQQSVFEDNKVDSRGGVVRSWLWLWLVTDRFLVLTHGTLNVMGGGGYADLCAGCCIEDRRFSIQGEFRKGAGWFHIQHLQLYFSNRGLEVGA